MKTPSLPNPKNENILVYINGQLLPRSEAKVSVFDSVVQGGDAVWEGIRVYDGKIYKLNEHLGRLMDSAKVMDFKNIPSTKEVKAAIFQTLEANQMKDLAHLRLTLTRGEKVTSGMNPKWNQSGCTLIVLAEWKPTIYKADQGLRLITSSIRRNSPQFVDSKIHHNNLINNILAKIEANYAGMDGAVMLDINGYVSETNATNIFFVRNEKITTPFADSCLPGITRNTVIQLAQQFDFTLDEKNISMAEMYIADEVFVTGTEGEIAPVVEIDGRMIGSGKVGSITQNFQKLLRAQTEKEGEKLPF